MKYHSNKDLGALWARHNAEWRDPAQIVGQWRDAVESDPKLLRYTARGSWWETLEKTRITLLVTREYEHLVMAIRAAPRGPAISYMCMPHPSGIAVNRGSGMVYISSTRNPNQLYEFLPVIGMMPRLDVNIESLEGCPLVPVRSYFYPGCLYMHDLALIDNALYANSVGQNCVIRLHDKGSYERVWWPRCIETENGPAFGQNYIQLNSIAAGDDLKSSFFSASADKLSSVRPGHKNFPVDKRGVIFSGSTREVIVRGLTRPHSARLYKGKIWVANSGYGEFGFTENGGFSPILKLPGWTRGLCFYKNIAFIGTSRIIPRFLQYAPGLDADSSLCGIYAVDIKSGQVLGSLIWPYGNQIFAIDWILSQVSLGFPFSINANRTANRKKILFYAFETNATREESK
jgi:uncharacterized protein (TIGR03032 family)